MVGGLAESGDAFVQSRRRVHHQHLDPVIQIAERADDAGVCSAAVRFAMRLTPDTAGTICRP